jgi:hypothetical protein
VVGVVKSVEKTLEKSVVDQFTVKYKKRDTGPKNKTGKITG